VPANHLPHNTCPLERGTDVPLEQVVGTHRFLALEPDRREDKIRICLVERLPFPLPQRRSTNGCRGTGRRDAVFLPSPKRLRTHERSTVTLRLIAFGSA
jgi:hypothetical protein